MNLDDDEDDDDDKVDVDDDDDVLMFPGWSTRDGELRGPVGYDVYSFGYRDLQGDIAIVSISIYLIYSNNLLIFIIIIIIITSLSSSHMSSYNSYVRFSSA